MTIAGVAQLLTIYLTVQLGPVTLSPVETIVLVVALAALLLSGINLWSLGGREERQVRLAAFRAGASGSTEALENSRPPPWYRKLGGRVAASPIVGASDRDRLLALLTTAGIRGQGRLATMVATKVCGAIVFGALFWLLTEWYQILTTMFAGRLALLLGGLILGWRLPDLVLSRLASRRRQRLEDGMPDAIDMLVVCAEAGLTLNQAIDEVSRGLRPSSPTVSEELAITAAEMRVQPDVEAVLDNLVNRTGLDSLRGLLSTLKQSLKFGTPLAESLRILAAEMRAVRQTRMEERAARLPVLLAIPMGLFILPPLLMVVGTPVALHLTDTMGSIFGTR